MATLDTVRSFLTEEHGLAVVFTAAGGDHDDWDTYDQTMRDQARIRGNS